MSCLFSPSRWAGFAIALCAVAAPTSAQELSDPPDMLPAPEPDARPHPQSQVQAQAQAQPQTRPELPPESQSLWELGAVGITGRQVAYPGSDTRLSRTLVLPYGVYRGPVVRAGDGGMGVRALKTPVLELDVGFSGSFGANSSEVPIRAGMPSLGTLLEFGPRLKLSLPPWLPGTRVGLDLPVRAVLDLSDSLRMRGTAVEPGLDLGWHLPGGVALNARLSAIYADRRLNDYLYGVEPQFENLALQRPAFQARGGLMAKRLAVSASTRLSRDLQAIGYVRWQSVAGAANEDSPLVLQTLGVTAGVSLAWTWLRSERTASD